MKKSFTQNRKKDHIQICLNENVDFKQSNGFEKYSFIHHAVTEVIINKISLSTKFFEKTISFPFLISCMTGGTKEAENINKELAIAAETLNIAVGVGSQRQALENDLYHESYKLIRKNAPTIPILGNLGASEISKMKNLDKIQQLIDLIEADAFVIHLNPAQELFQKEGNTNFYGLLKSIEKLSKKINIPIIAKEVGNGIDYNSALKLLNVGVKGIDVAGSGGTCWQAVEMRRNNNINNNFLDWGLPTSYCINDVKRLKDKNNFILIASGGIRNGIEISKAIALGADICGSANPILKILFDKGINGVVDTINSWFEDVKKIMYLTGSLSLQELDKTKLIKTEDLF
ncbi:MAG: type 2 isopentenyl-diphosphate Delta-isomerase [bacterium]